MTMALTQLTIGDARFRAGRWQGRADLATLVPLSAAQTLDRQSLSTARNILRNQGFQAVVTAAVAPPERAAFLLDDFSEREHLHLLRYDLQPRFAASGPDRANRSGNSDPTDRTKRSGNSDPTDRTKRSGNSDNSDRSKHSDNSDSTKHSDNSDSANRAGSQLLKSWQRIRPWPRPRPRIRRGTSRDWDDVLTLDRQSFDEFWHFDRDGLQDSIEATPASRLRIIRRFDVAEPPDTNERTDDKSNEAKHNQIVGYALAGHSGGSGYLQRLAVHPAYRQQGIGALLVNDALCWIRRRGARIAWVNTQKTNSNALQLYKNLGFTLQEHPLTVMYRTLT